MKVFFYEIPSLGCESPLYYLAIIIFKFPACFMVTQLGIYCFVCMLWVCERVLLVF